MAVLVSRGRWYVRPMSTQVTPEPAVEIVPAPTPHALSEASVPRDRNPCLVYLARLRSPTSRATMEGALRRAAGLLAGRPTAPEDLPWHLLRYQHVADLRGKLESEGSKPRTINKILCAVRGTITEARKLGLIAREDAVTACEVEGFTVDDLPAGRSVERDETERLISALPDTVAGKRDGAIIALLFGGGMRRAEAASVDLAAVDRGRWEVRVRGKRAKERLVPLPPRAVALLRAWLAVRGEEPGPLLASFDLQGRLRRDSQGRIARVSPTGIYVAFRGIAERAGVENVSPHDARRTRATAMLSAGESITHVRDIMGHDDVRTTARYDRSSDDAKRVAANRVDL